ncbi:hypothetical protein MG296_08400 [Flavobacteriaceae bacterium TK19130]|nr:hypothetical protein [Thermobacterium salinum]
MKNNRFRFPKITVTVITLILLALFSITAIRYVNNPDWLYGQPMLIMMGLAFLIQIILNIANWRSEKKIVILATLFVSATIAASMLWRFIALGATPS